jgi:hypothetical protein
MIHYSAYCQWEIIPFESLQQRFCRVASKVVLLGEYSPGKTTALYKMKLDTIFHTVPTVGFNV